MTWTSRGGLSGCGGVGVRREGGSGKKRHDAAVFEINDEVVAVWLIVEIDEARGEAGTLGPFQGVERRAIGGSRTAGFHFFGPSDTRITCGG